MLVCEGRVTTLCAWALVNTLPAAARRVWRGGSAVAGGAAVLGVLGAGRWPAGAGADLAGCVGGAPALPLSAAPGVLPAARGDRKATSARIARRAARASRAGRARRAAAG